MFQRLRRFSATGGNGPPFPLVFRILAAYNAENAEWTMKKNNPTLIAGKPGRYQTFDLGYGRTMTTGQSGYKSYEFEDQCGRAFGQDNERRQWTSTTFGGQKVTTVRKRS
jgi:hypothetical protein